ncbi:MAG: alpha/beta hydrolase, partial [Candidatus Poribacteria bacterium]|nr:alpha/beta hydrolase [Candidatus Poribacteria bacterium]
MRITVTLVLILFFVLTALVIAQRRDPAAASKVLEGITVHRDLAYVTDGHERQKLDLYVPDEGENLSLIIWIHGGAWRGGS